MALIAKVVVAAMAAGVRKDFQPGEELPELDAADVEALKAMGAIVDSAEAEKAAKAEAAADKAAGKDFAEARKKAKAERDATAQAA